MTSTRWPAGSLTNQRGAFHALLPSRGSNPCCRRRSIVSASGATTAACPSSGIAGSWRGMRWMCVPPRSTHVKRRRLSGGSISVKPSSAQNATQSRTCCGRTSSDTCWSTCRSLCERDQCDPGEGGGDAGALGAAHVLAQDRAGEDDGGERVERAEDGDQAGHPDRQRGREHHVGADVERADRGERGDGLAVQ